MWNIGGAVNNQFLLNIVLKLNQIKPQLVSSVYDCYTFLKWMGGRPLSFIPALSSADYFSRVELLNRNGIGYFHVFSNYFITKKDLGDPQGNYFLERTENSLNGVVCGTPVLGDYIRRKYPGFKLIGSCTIEQKNDLSQLKALQDYYDYLVLFPRLNRQPELIGRLDPRKLEILVSESCFPDCRVMRRHNDLINKWNLSHDLKDFDNYQNFFNKDPRTCVNRMKQEKNLKKLQLTREEIRNFKATGIPLFKLQERFNPVATMKNICKFVIRYADYPLTTKLRLLNVIPGKYRFA